MKNSIFLGLVVWGAVVVLPNQLSAQTGNNLLNGFNPGFESGLSSWSGSGFKNGSVDSTNPGAGSYSGKQVAELGNNWNVLVNTGGTIPVVPGNCYVLSALSRHNLVGGTASLGLNELNSSMVSTNYGWRVVTDPATWHHEYLTFTPRSDTNYLRVYLWLSINASGGAAWWDNLRLDTFTNPFLNSANRSIQVSVPSVVFNYDGGAISPGTLAPVVKIGDRFSGGILAWKLVKEIDGTNGAAVLQDSYAIGQAGNWQWSINMSQIAPLGEGRYFLNVTAVSADGTETEVVTKPLAVVGLIASMGTNSPAPITSSTIDANGRLLVNGAPFQAVMYYGTLSGVATDYAEVRKLGGNSVLITGNSLATLSANIDLAWSHGLYSWVVLMQPPFTQSVGSLGPTTTWDLTYLKNTINALKTKPGVIGWDLMDEPDGLGIPVSAVQAAYNTIKDVSCDPNHVVWVNLTNNQAKSINYPNCSDFASYDLYPFPLRELFALDSGNEFIMQLHPNKPLISVLQGFSTSGFPSFSQLRANLYTNVCDGMVHPFYFQWHGLPSNCLVNKPEIRAYTQLLNWEMMKLQPFLFSTASPLSVNVSHPDVKAIAKSVGGDVILILVNESDQPIQNVTAAVAGSTFSSHTAFFPGTSSGNLSGGHLVDSLPSYGVGIYRLH